jgi:acetyl-CoA carboxylase biotin carboxyl carrier protein
LIRLLDETSLSEIHLESDSLKLYLKKPESERVLSIQPTSNQMPQVAVSQASAETTPVETVQTTAPATVVNESKADENVQVITSPMVGTFYRASSPDAPSFVEVGAKVNDKTVVCIVEAMKLMNEIEAEMNGEIVEILAQNGQLVEYGQPLFKIRLS